MAEEQQPESHQPEMPKRPGGRRRGRRGGRGRRRPPISQAPVSETEAPIESAEPVEQEFSESGTPPSPKQFSPKRRGSPLMQAADEVVEIIEALKHTLTQMEEVLELIEHAERQKISDEHEIESLRRALRQIQSRRPN